MIVMIEMSALLAGVHLQNAFSMSKWGLSELH